MHIHFINYSEPHSQIPHKFLHHGTGLAVINVLLGHSHPVGDDIVYVQIDHFIETLTGIHRPSINLLPALCIRDTMEGVTLEASMLKWSAYFSRFTLP